MLVIWTWPANQIVRLVLLRLVCSDVQKVSVLKQSSFYYYKKFLFPVSVLRITCRYTCSLLPRHVSRRWRMRQINNTAHYSDLSCLVRQRVCLTTRVHATRAGRGINLFAQRLVQQSQTSLGRGKWQRPESAHWWSTRWRNEVAVTSSKRCSLTSPITRRRGCDNGVIFLRHVRASIEYWLVGGSCVFDGRDASAAAAFPTIASNHFAALRRKLIVNSHRRSAGQCQSDSCWTVAVSWPELLPIACRGPSEPTWAGPWDWTVVSVSLPGYLRLSAMYLEPMDKVGMSGDSHATR